MKRRSHEGAIYTFYDDGFGVWRDKYGYVAQAHERELLDSIDNALMDIEWPPLR